MAFLNSLKILSKLRMTLLFSAFLFVSAQAQTDSIQIVQQILKHRVEQDQDMRSKTSPLEKRDRRKFKGLHYFPIDLHYRVQGKFVRNAAPILLKMKTTTSRLPEYLVYGEVQFELEGNLMKLQVYQSPEISSRKGYEDYLFIPFTDDTNGNETYEGGRYLDFKIPEGEDVVLDFNLCYNPYCSYNHNYSCPVPPAENHLPIPIKAGEMKLKEH
jgi:uncharacterized protein (DUF1684 family)